jgi:hypothetical protein
MSNPLQDDNRSERFRSLASPECFRLAIATLSMLALSGCGRDDLGEARRLVERYNHVVSEAYRRGDPQLIDPVVGPNDGRRITGLIGVRSDLGLTMDATLLSLDVTAVEKTKDVLRVRTRESWKYRDLKIGTGEQIGEASKDNYEMVYVFFRTNQEWLVDEIQFGAVPQVGRRQGTWIHDRAQLTNQPAKQEAQP